MNVVHDNFSKQVIRELTRVDNIFYLLILMIIRDDLGRELNVGGHLGNSDHGKARFSLRWEEAYRNINFLQRHNFRRVDYEELRRHLERINWDQVDGDGEVKSVREDRGFLPDQTK